MGIRQRQLFNIYIYTSRRKITWFWRLKRCADIDQVLVFLIARRPTN